MAEKLPNHLSPESDEIDLGQLLRLVKKGFYRLGNFFLRVYRYLKKNALKLLGLIVLGTALGYGLKMVVPTQMKTEAIVRPNFDSKDYLYEVVDEIQANIKAKNEGFFGPFGISIENLKGFNIQVEAIVHEDKLGDDAALDEMKYLEVLQNFKNESFVIDILRTELNEKSIVDHKITFAYKDAATGPEIAAKLLDYINSNTYFDNLKKVYRENAEYRMAKNQALIDQIDQLVANYSKSLVAENRGLSAGTVNIAADNAMNVPNLLIMKNTLLKEIETKKLELAQQAQTIGVLNLGKPQEVKKPFFNQKIILVPILFVLAFFGLSMITYLNRKSSELP